MPSLTCDQQKAHDKSNETNISAEMNIVDTCAGGNNEVAREHSGTDSGTDSVPVETRHGRLGGLLWPGFHRTRSAADEKQQACLNVKTWPRNPIRSLDTYW